MKTIVSFFVFFWICTLTPSVFCQVSKNESCEKISERLGQETLKGFRDSALFSYFDSTFGPIKGCEYGLSPSKGRRDLVVIFQRNLRVTISNVKTPRGPFTWISVYAPKPMTDVSGIYRTVIDYYKNMQLKLNWNKYKLFYEGDDRILIYCDHVYNTGSLGMARFRKDRILSIQFGFLHEHFCPNSLGQFEALMNGQ